MFKPLLAVVLAAATLAACAASPLAHANTTAKHADNAFAYQLPPFPATAHRDQTTAVKGHTLKYTVTIGWLPVRDDKGKTIAQVVYTAYTMPGKNRPVTFALNGGPGTASVFPNFGAIGPKTVDFGAAGDTPSEPATLHDNPNTWLGLTDLVFIDPVPATAARWCATNRRPRISTRPTPTSIISRRSFTTGW